MTEKSLPPCDAIWDKNDEIGTSGGGGGLIESTGSIRYPEDQTPPQPSLYALKGQSREISYLCFYLVPEALFHSLKYCRTYNFEFAEILKF